MYVLVVSIYVHVVLQQLVSVQTHLYGVVSDDIEMFTEDTGVHCYREMRTWLYREEDNLHKSLKTHLMQKTE